MRRLRSLLRVERLLALLALVLALGFAPARAGAGEAGQPMQLEVFINGNPTQLIGTFVLFDDRRIGALKQELVESGLKPPGNDPPDKLIVLDDIFGLKYQYEEATQRILITAPEELLAPKVFDLSNRPPSVPPVESNYGAVLNYNLFASGASGGQSSKWMTFSGASASFDGHLFTPYGTFAQGAILQSTVSERFQALRLNSTYSYSDYESMMTYRAGDTINGGLAWTRPVRIGGLQAQRNFGLRPDLITVPLPSARGSAAVPSTADIYINNVKTYSQDISPGPFVLNNLPAITGSGAARVVLRDASGRATETVLPFYASSVLLAPGTLDFSVEAGVPRLSFGTTADTYAMKPVGSASVRYGAFDWLTLAGHAEGGAGLLNASAGVMARTGPYGVASAAFSASHYRGATGYQSYLAYETKILGLSISASSQMTFGAYDDLASVTARIQQDRLINNPFDVTSFDDVAASVANAATTSLYTTARAPKAFNRISVGAPLPFVKRASVTASFIQSTNAAGVHSNIASATLSAGLGTSSVFATAFTTLSGEKNTGFMVGLSMPFGDTGTISTSASGGSGGTRVNLDAVKPLDLKPGSFGWQVHDSELGDAQRSAAASYRSRYFRTAAGVSQDRNGIQTSAEVEGAVATMGGGVFFSNRIDDAFAVIETGVPNVEVFHENRSVGFTDSSGRAMVTGLRSYQANKLAIDTTKLPVDADVAMTETVIAPGDRAGVKVDFAVHTDVRPAVVVFKGANGEPLAAGARGQLEGGESFTVGYDGRAYIKNLAATNTATIATAAGECRASFEYEPHPNEQVLIPSVVCR